MERDSRFHQAVTLCDSRFKIRSDMALFRGGPAKLEQDPSHEVTSKEALSPELFRGHAAPARLQARSLLKCEM